MKNKKIEILIYKFLSNTATEVEIEDLTQWALKNPSNFQQEVELHHLITGAFEKEKAEKLKRQFIETFDQDKIIQKPRRIYRLLKYAAIFIGLVSLGVYTYLVTDEKKGIPANEVTITLEDGSSKEVLEENASGVVTRSNTYTSKQNGSKLVYKKVALQNQKERLPLTYNTLDVPYGKKFQVVLSDGTEVYLNSGSSLTYPVAFYDDGPRDVVLKGEAYFTVESDSLRPFFVSTEFVKTKVLGTEFNISSYYDDKRTNVVLVEGSLSVGEKNNLEPEAFVLIPNQLAAYSYSDKKLEVENVDVRSHIAWKDGILLFKNEDFHHISKKLERHFDITIEIKSLKLGEERYTGRFKTETIEEVLEAFQRIKGFDYTIKNKKIRISPKK